MMVCLFFLVFFSFSEIIHAIPFSPDQTIRIAFVSDGLIPGSLSLLDLTEEKIRQELVRLTEGEFSLSFFPVEEFLADWTVDGAKNAIERALSDERVDILIANGFLTSHYMMQMKEIAKPSFAPFILDLHSQCSQKLASYHTRNLCLTTFPCDPNKDLTLFTRLVPLKLSKVTFLLGSCAEEISQLIKKQLEPILHDLHIEGRYLSSCRATGEILKELDREQSDGVYLFPLPRLPEQETISLISAITARGIPTFSAIRSYIDLGAMATLAESADIERLWRRTALNVQQVILGGHADELSSCIPIGGEVTLNMTTVAALRSSIPADILMDSEHITTGPSAAKTLNLIEAAKYAINQNQGLESERWQLRADQEEIAQARAQLLPQINSSFLPTAIDRRRAQLSDGSAPERALYGRITASQMIFSDPLITNYQVATHQFGAQESQFRSDMLDLYLDTTTAYLNVLRSATLSEIQRQNLALTKTNLKIALNRELAGTTRKNEVYRWQSEVATNLASAIAAYYSSEQARITLLRLIASPQNSHPSLQQVDLDEKFWLLQPDFFSHYLTNAAEIERYAFFASRQALKNSPDLRIIEEQLLITMRNLGLAMRAFYLPQCFFTFDLSDQFTAEGIGSSGLSATIHPWSAIVNFSFPLYQGGERRSNLRQQKKLLRSLIEQHSYLQSTIERNVRTSLYQAIGSFSAIALAKESATAAQMNLDLVTEAYLKGANNIVDLIDAQSQALLANQNRANSVYDFLIDYLAFQRTLNQFDFELSQPELLSKRKAIIAFIKEAIVKP